MDDFSGAAGFLGVASTVGCLALGVFLTRRGRRKLRLPAPPSASAGDLVAAASHRLRVRPFDRMVTSDREAVLRLLERADAAASNPVLHARINLMLAEMALIAGRPEHALERYRTVLRWTPRAPIVRTIATLERRLSPSIPVALRLIS